MFAAVYVSAMSVKVKARNLQRIAINTSEEIGVALAVASRAGPVVLNAAAAGQSATADAASIPTCRGFQHRARTHVRQ
jgi:hypothetical protein